MRPIPALLAIVAIAGGVEAVGSGAADAQCSVFSRHPCVPNVCSVFSRHPCVPEPVYPFSGDLRLTIHSAAAEAPKDNPEAAFGLAGSDAQATNAGQERKLNTIGDLFQALRACWMPPPRDEARRGMQMSVRIAFKRDGEMIGAPRVTYVTPDAPPATRDTYHDAILAALDRCTPLRFSASLGGAMAGRPIAIRYVDDRSLQ